MSATHPNATTTLSPDQQLERDGRVRNTAFPQDSFWKSVTNYLVWGGGDPARRTGPTLRSSASCTTCEEAARTSSSTMSLDPDTIVGKPDWADPKVGKPEGRVCSFSRALTLRDISIGRSDTRTVAIHATVLADRTAKLFNACERGACRSINGTVR